MSGYTVEVRIERVRPRVVRRDPHPRVAGLGGDATGGIEASGEVTDALPPDPRWEAFRQHWAELTFYLFDPESWRT